MNRTELFDILLKNRAESKTESGFLDLQTYAEQKLNITDHSLIESIVDEMIENNWVKPSNYSKYSVCATYEGKQLIEKFGSYSSFLRDLKKSETKDQVQKRTDRRLNNISKISAIFFGLTSFILGYNKFFVDDIKIDNQQTDIKALNKTIDSLKTELKKRHTTTAIIQRGDSTKTKNINNN